MNTNERKSSDRSGESANSNSDTVWHTNSDFIDVTTTTSESASKNVRRTEAPDGGWGWVIMIASYISLAMNFGLQESYGLFYTVMTERYDVPLGTVTWVGSCSTGLGSIAGGLAPAIINRLGGRLSGVLATGLMSGGIFLSLIVDNVYAMYITFGWMPGFALYIQLLNCMIMLNRYFHRRRVLVVGLAYSSAGMGSVIFAPLLTALMSTFGFWGMLLITGAITLNQLCCVLTFRPLSETKQDNMKEESVPKQEQAKGGSNGYISLLKRKTTWCVVLSAVTYGLVCFYFSSFAPAAAKLWLKEVPLEKISLIISVYGLANMGSRVVIGCVFAAVQRSVIPTYIGSVCGCGLVLAVLPFCSSYETMMGAGAAYGLFYGMFVSLFPTLAMELFGPHLFSYAFGIVFVVSGSCSLFGVPLAGFIYDRTLNFNIIFFMGAGGFFLGVLCLMPLAFPRFRRLDASLDILTLSVEPQQKSKTYNRSKA